MCPKESIKDGERTRGHDFWGLSEDTWFIQLGEEKPEGWLHCWLQPPHEDSRKGGAGLSSLVARDRTWDRLKAVKGKSRLDMRKKFFMGRVIKQKAGRSSPGKPWWPQAFWHSGQHSRSMVSVLGCPGWSQRYSWVPSNLGYSVIPWVVHVLCVRDLESPFVHFMTRK